MGTVVSVQTAAAVLAGVTSALLTNPLDLLKTRVQVAESAAPGGLRLSWSAALREIIAQDGPAGLLRGLAPRMASSALWGTAMVSTYELLKRVCALPPSEPGINDE